MTRRRVVVMMLSEVRASETPHDFGRHDRSDGHPCPRRRRECDQPADTHAEAREPADRCRCDGRLTPFAYVTNDTALQVWNVQSGRTVRLRSGLSPHLSTRQRFGKSARNRRNARRLDHAERDRQLTRDLGASLREIADDEETHSSLRPFVVTATTRTSRSGRAIGSRALLGPRRPARGQQVEDEAKRRLQRRHAVERAPLADRASTPAAACDRDRRAGDRVRLRGRAPRRSPPTGRQRRHLLRLGHPAQADQAEHGEGDRLRRWPPRRPHRHEQARGTTTPRAERCCIPGQSTRKRPPRSRGTCVPTGASLSTSQTHVPRLSDVSGRPRHRQGPRASRRAHTLGIARCGNRTTRARVLGEHVSVRWDTIFVPTARVLSMIRSG